MANFDYTQLLASARSRRIDPRSLAALVKESDVKPEFSDVVKYVSISMSPVDPRSTEIYNEEATRVERQLASMPGYDLDFARQGSVPLNIHIRTVSDVDVICINKAFYTGGPVTGSQFIPYGPDIRETQRTLRNDSLSKLKTAYWGATVDGDSSGKAIKMSGGSLRRNVDVAIANWHNTDEYIRTQLRIDRAIKVYDAKLHDLIFNHPFLHMREVDIHDVVYAGCHKRYIRLLKCLAEDLSIKGMSSYDITSMIYHCVDNRLRQAHSLLDNMQYLGSYLWTLRQEEAIRESLDVPNKTRKIFERNAERIEALNSFWYAVYRIIEDMKSAPVMRYISNGQLTEAA